MPNFLQTEHSKKQEALADYQAFIRTELEERQHLVEAIRTSGLDYKMAVLSVQEAVNDLNRQLKMLIDDFYKQRVFVDAPFPISASIPYEIDYRERKYVFMWSAQALSLTPQDGGPVIPIAANQWNNISFRRGLKLFASAIPDSQYATVIVRCTDVPLSEFVTVNNSTTQPVNINISEVGGGNVNVNQGVLISSSSDYPNGAIPLTADSGNQANAVATATLAANASRTTYITGFEVTGSGATAGLVVTVTVTGVVTGTLHFTYAAAVGVLVENTPLIVEFPKPIPSSAVNTAISVSCPALGAGNTNNTVVAHGYQL